MIGYIELPDFQTGDIVSASRLNAVARNIDVAVGLDEQRNWPVEAGANVLNCGVYSRASDARFAGAEVEYYIAHNGDRLEFFHRRDGFSSTANLTYNYGGTGAQTWNGLASNVAHALTLNSLPRYKIVKVRIVGVGANDRLFVRRLFAYDSNAQAIGTMPYFVNGTASDAGDLNTIMAGTKRAVTQLNQPIAGLYGIRVNGDNADLSFATNRNGYFGYIRHKHDKLYVHARGECDGRVAGDRMYITYNGTEIWSWEAGNLGQNTVDLDDYLDLPAGLSVGTWYPVEFRVSFSADRRQRFTIWQMCEANPNVSATVPTIDRWTHGDKVFGDADGPPELITMSDALDGISSPLSWTNPACRAGTGWVPNLSGVCTTSSEKYDEFGSVRVHKWLAYENIEKAVGGRANVTLQYRETSNQFVFASVSLPAVNRPSYYDLDNTPVKPGMYFRLVGSKFCIQTPGYEGE